MTPRRPYAERVPNTSPCRLVQWTTDNVGKSAVAATNDVDALLALKPDCVVYNPMRIDVDELRQPAVDRGRGHLRQGRQDHRHEAADTTFYDSPATEKPVGFGEPIDHPDLQAMTAKGTGVFGEAADGGRRARHRARRGALRGRVRTDHRGISISGRGPSAPHPAARGRAGRLVRDRIAVGLPMRRGLLARLDPRRFARHLRGADPSPGHAHLRLRRSRRAAMHRVIGRELARLQVMCIAAERGSRLRQGGASECRVASMTRR
jgi:hypothetical protein